MRYLLSDEGDEIRCQLVDSGVGLDASKSSILPFGIRLVDQGRGEFGKEFLGFLREDVLYERLDVDII